MANLNLPPVLSTLSAEVKYKDTNEDTKENCQVWWCNAYLNNNYISKDITTLPYCQIVDTHISTRYTTYDGKNIGKLLQVSGRCNGYRSIYEHPNYKPTHAISGEITYATTVTGKNSIKYWITKEYNDRLLNDIYANNEQFSNYQLTNYLPTTNYKTVEMNHNVIENTLNLLSIINNAKINGNLNISSIVLNNVSSITTNNNVSTKGNLRLSTDNNFTKFSDMDKSELTQLAAQNLVDKDSLRDILLNNILSTKSTELDTDSIIAADDVNTIYKVLIPLANDCICYSNCNSYYVCTCYGNCGCNY